MISLESWGRGTANLVGLAALLLGASKPMPACSEFPGWAARLRC
jgi:hypothetical protein